MMEKRLEKKGNHTALIMFVLVSSRKENKAAAL